MNNGNPLPRRLKKVICFGEVLWNHRPSGEVAGGAPVNVAWHLTRMGFRATLLSAVGRDEPGNRMLKWLNEAGIDARRVAIHSDLPTGSARHVQAEGGEPRDEIQNPAAWDRIPVDDSTLHATTASHALVFGTLASRSPENRAALKFLVSLWEPLKVFNVNLQAPFDDMAVAMELARRSDVIKVNEAELFQLADIAEDDIDETDIRDAADRLSAMTGCQSICVTRGAAGVLFLHHGQWHSASQPILDTNASTTAGDAFTAALTAFLLSHPEERELGKGLALCSALGALVASSGGAHPEYDAAKVLEGVPWIGPQDQATS